MKKLYQYFWTLLECLVVISFISMIGIMFIQVVSRYALGIGVPWTDETSRFIFISVIFIGFAIAEKTNANIKIDILINVLPLKAQRYFYILSKIITLAVLICLMLGSLEMISKTGSVSASTINISFSTLYMIQFFGILLTVLIVIKKLIKSKKFILGSE